MTDTEREICAAEKLLLVKIFGALSELYLCQLPQVPRAAEVGGAARTGRSAASQLFESAGRVAACLALSRPRREVLGQGQSSTASEQTKINASFSLLLLFFYVFAWLCVCVCACVRACVCSFAFLFSSS